MSIRALQTDPEVLGVFRKILVRSTAYAISAYFISFILERLLIIGGALLKGYSITFKYNSLKITAVPGAWDQESVLLIYLIPLFLETIMFILLYLSFLKMEYKSNYSKIFLLWVMFFIVFRLLGIIPGHLILQTGIFYAMNWLNFGTAIMIVAGLSAGGLFFFTGFQILKGIIALSGTYHYYIRELGVPNLIFSSLIIPMAVVCLTAFLFYLPELPFEEIIGLVFLLVLNIYIFFKLFRLDPKIFSFKEKVAEKNNTVWILTFALFAVTLLRIILGLDFSAG